MANQRLKLAAAMEVDIDVVVADIAAEHARLAHYVSPIQQHTELGFIAKLARKLSRFNNDRD